MKLIKSALIASSLLALSSQVFANDWTTMHVNKVIETDTVAAQSTAYQLALNQLNELKTDSASELNHAIGHIAPDSRSLELQDGGYITVSEKMNSNGNMVYTGQVHVNVTYDING